jgi:hypothetical protein
VFEALLARLRRHNASGGSIPTLFPEFPHDVHPPQDVLRRIREEDPNVDLLYFGWGKWYLVRFKPNREHLETGAERIREAKRMLRKWETDQLWKTNPGAFRRLYGRYLYWLVVCQGGRPIAEYTRREFIELGGFSGIISDLRCMLWMQRHTSDNTVHRELVREQDEALEAARNEFADEYAAKDVCDYLNKRTHSVTRHDNPETARTRSGFTTIAAIGADGKHRSIA